MIICYVGCGELSILKMHPFQSNEIPSRKTAGWAIYVLWKCTGIFTEDYKINHNDRDTLDNFTDLGKKQMSFMPWEIG